MSNKSPREVLEAKSNSITLSRDMESLLQNKTFQYLLKQIKEKRVGLVDGIIQSKSWEEMIQKRSYFLGLGALEKEIDTIISKGKSTARTLTIK